MAVGLGSIRPVYGQSPEPDASAETRESNNNRDGNIIELRHCVVSYAESAQLGAAERSVIEELMINRGTPVKAGQVLARLQDGETRAQMARFKYEAASDTELRIAHLKYKQAVNRLAIDTSLRKRNAASPEQLFASQVEVDLAAAAYHQANEHKTIAQFHYDEAAARLRSKQIISPYDGVVGDLFKHPGESVVEGTPVCRVDNVDKLLVTGKLDLADILRVHIGDTISMQISVNGVDLPIEHQRFTGIVSYIDTKIDTTTYTCAIICSVTNPDRLAMAGMEAVVTVDLNQPTLAGRASSATNAAHASTK